MVFVTADSCRSHLERLTRLLVSAFPGSTIFQHTDLHRVPHDVLSHNVDAFFWGVESDPSKGLDVVQMLRRQKADLPVFIISQTEELREKAVEAGVNDFFIKPVTEQQLIDAMQAMKK